MVSGRPPLRRSPCGSVDRNRRTGPLPTEPMKSLPVRERGSKQMPQYFRRSASAVAPRAGAWIETPASRSTSPILTRRSPCGSVDRNSASAGGEADGCVAPRAGAWIETPTHRPPVQTAPSLPVRERGSKHHDVGVRIAMRLVAPRAGAWIETTGSRHPRADAEGRSPCGSVDRNWLRGPLSLGSTQSLPVRERGSKRACLDIRWQQTTSLPVRERGSKPGVVVCPASAVGVAPRAGAWIET